MESKLYEKGGDSFSLHICKVLPFFSQILSLGGLRLLITQIRKIFNFVVHMGVSFQLGEVYLCYSVRLCLTCATEMPF